MTRFVLLAVVVVTVFAPHGLAQIPEKISWQGYLSDNDGPLDGPVRLTISLYPEKSGGSWLWQKDTTGVVADKGIVNVPLGPFPGVSFKGPLYVGVGVDGGAELAPRSPLTSVPYALALRGLVVEPANDGIQQGVNVLAGAANNTIAPGVVGGTIGGGGGNQGATPLPNLVGGDFGTVGGGFNNTASDHLATIAGGGENTASGQGAVVAGGYLNTASGLHDTVAGGSGNTASGGQATVGGGAGNTSAHNATVGGGLHNNAGGGQATIGGGSYNTASSDHATIGGGYQNTASGDHATIAGGFRNAASGFAAVGGGLDNKASKTDATVAGGRNNIASGSGATVAGGRDNQARGSFSFAAGHYARAGHYGSFVWSDYSSGSDSTGTPDSTTTWKENLFLARAAGGTYFYTNSTRTTGAYLASGGSSWNSVSDRAAKENLVPVETDALLDRIASIPIGMWNYIEQDDTIRHVGPMAQDFNTLLPGLGGEGENNINSLDADGVALAAIQGLYKQLVEERRRNDALEDRVTGLERLIAEGR